MYLLVSFSNHWGNSKLIWIILLWSKIFLTLNLEITSETVLSYTLVVTQSNSDQPFQWLNTLHLDLALKNTTSCFQNLNLKTSKIQWCAITEHSKNVSKAHGPIPRVPKRVYEWLITIVIEQRLPRWNNWSSGVFFSFVFKSVTLSYYPTFQSAVILQHTPHTNPQNLLFIPPTDAIVLIFFKPKTICKMFVSRT